MLVLVYLAGGFIVGTIATCLSTGIFRRPAMAGYRLRVRKIPVGGNVDWIINVTGTFSQALSILYDSYPQNVAQWKVQIDNDSIVGTYDSYEFLIYPLDPDVHMDETELLNVRRFLAGTEK